MKANFLFPRYSISFLFLIFSFFSSCNNDKSKGNASPELLTLQIIGSNPNHLTFGVQFESLGKSKVIGYGVVYSTDQDNEGGGLTDEPSLANHILNFDEPIDVNPKFKSIGFRSINIDCYYRSYAKLEDGRVVYGNVKHIYL